MALKPTSKKTIKTVTTEIKAPAAYKTTSVKAEKTPMKAAAVAAPVVPSPAQPLKPAKPVKAAIAQPKSDKLPVDFTFYAPQAGSVMVAGDFTQWEAAPVALQKRETGVWSATIPLPPGRYQYRLLVDGQWQNDPQCRDLEPNAFGSANCVRQVAA